MIIPLLASSTVYLASSTDLLASMTQLVTNDAAGGAGHWRLLDGSYPEIRPEPRRRQPLDSMQEPWHTPLMLPQVPGLAPHQAVPIAPFVEAVTLTQLRQSGGALLAALPGQVIEALDEDALIGLLLLEAA